MAKRTKMPTGLNTPLRSVAMGKAPTVQRVLSVALAFAIITAASVWVVGVRFKEGKFDDCGVPLGSAVYGVFSARTEQHGAGTQNQRLVFTTACRAQSRTRVGIAAVAIIGAVGILKVSRRRWGRAPPIVTLDSN